MHFIRGKDSQGEEVIKPYTPTTLDADVGYFELVIKMYPQGRMSHHSREMREVGNNDGGEVTAERGGGWGTMRVGSGDEGEENLIVKRGMVGSGYLTRWCKAMLYLKAPVYIVHDNFLTFVLFRFVIGQHLDQFSVRMHQPLIQLLAL
ncbi:Oxidoreductase, FAD-binding domain-containing protein [Cynara cardunculus var. scolymus]|uniref:Oxidoreductase, FAD-binding domain-containing protein n=1 Tax=Cynara cardunculus var. scolymus TaxID=59895 RepID=A0A103Y5Z2_CYNCS|nr:Oxidoreductase, FAD-binding domain-containing protein [Cynara cardunculus var. scolymus]